MKANLMHWTVKCTLLGVSGHCSQTFAMAAFSLRSWREHKTSFQPAKLAQA
jgi:hypothetical protein